MAIFGDFFGSSICSEPRASLSDLHSKFALGPRQVQKYCIWQTSNLWPLRLGKEKKEEEEDRKKLQGKNIMAPLLHRAAIIKPHRSTGIMCRCGLLIQTEQAQLNWSVCRSICRSVTIVNALSRGSCLLWRNGRPSQQLLSSCTSGRRKINRVRKVVKIRSSKKKIMWSSLLELLKFTEFTDASMPSQTILA